MSLEDIFLSLTTEENTRAAQPMSSTDRPGEHAEYGGAECVTSWPSPNAS